METNYGGKLNNTKVYGILLSCYIVYLTFFGRQDVQKQLTDPFTCSSGGR